VSDPRPGREPTIAARLNRGWTLFLALGAVVTLIVGVVTLYDRFAPKPSPTAGSGSSAGPAWFGGELSDPGTAEAFLTFIDDHDGETVELDISCYDDYKTSSCFLGEGIPADTNHLWIFTQERCFIESEAETNFKDCYGSQVFWIGKNAGTSFLIANGSAGAGSVIIKGRAKIRIAGMGGAIYPATVRTIDVTPID
jgi:hypothetical protein